MAERVLVLPNWAASNIPRWSLRRAYLIDLRTLAQAAVTTFSRPESATVRNRAKSRVTLGDQRPIGANARVPAVRDGRGIEFG
jgi:hypothetical protein